MPRYTLLLIDADDTLLDFEAAEQAAIANACAAVGLSITAEQAELYKQVNQDVWRMFERGEITQTRLRMLRFERFFQAIGADLDTGKMAEAFVRALSRQPDELPGARDFLREAAARVPVVVVTNGIAEVQRSRFALSPLSKYVKDYVISGEVGFAKPDPRMMDRALELLNGKAEDALMIGDSLGSDIAAANAAGVASCWLNPSGKANETGHVPTHEIRALDEALAWL